MTHNLDIVEKFFEEIAAHVYALKSRWKDEREYEDFADYKKDLVNFFGGFGLTVKNVSKSFKITFSNGDSVAFKNWGKVTLTAAKK